MGTVDTDRPHVEDLMTRINDYTGVVNLKKG